MIIGRRDDGGYIGVRDVKGTVNTVSESIRNKHHIIFETRAENIEVRTASSSTFRKGIRSWTATEGITLENLKGSHLSVNATGGRPKRSTR